MINQKTTPSGEDTTRRKRNALLVTFCVLIVIVVLGIAVYRGKSRLESASQWRPRPVPVTTDSVRRDTLRQTLSYLARLESVATSEISPELNARVMELYADDGDKVEAGALLARLDDRDLRLQLDTLKARIESQRARIRADQAALASARSTVSFLQKETERNQALFDKKAISASALDAHRDQLETAAGKARGLEEESRSMAKELDALSAQLEEAGVRLSYTEIRSPVKGTIGRRYVDVGDMMGPGTPLFSFLDLSAFRLSFNLVQEDLTLIRPGQKIMIKWPVDTPGDQQHGVLARIFPSLEGGKSVRAEVDLSCKCPEGIKVGAFIPLQVVLREETGLTVPRCAIVSLSGKGQGVYVVRQGELALVNVQADFYDETRALIQGDLREDEPVVIGEYLQWVRHYSGQPVEAGK